jgi:hypothetical protein
MFPSRKWTQPSLKLNRLGGFLRALHGAYQGDPQRLRKRVLGIERRIQNALKRTEFCACRNILSDLQLWRYVFWDVVPCRPVYNCLIFEHFSAIIFRTNQSMKSILFKVLTPKLSALISSVTSISIFQYTRRKSHNTWIFSVPLWEPQISYR